MNFLKLKFRASILGCLSAVICLSIFLTSCEKTEDVINMQTEEDNIITTDNDSKISIDQNDVVLESVFHMEINDDLSEEETNAQWDAKVKEYIAQQELEEPQLTERGATKDVYIRFSIRTGVGNNSGTNGKVKVRVNIDTDRGNMTSPWKEIYIRNTNGTANGGYVHYMKFRIKSGSIREAQLRWAELKLRGTDNWHVGTLNAFIYDWDQRVPATGKSVLQSEPNYWLKGKNSDAWDLYKSHNWSHKGKVRFK